MARFISVRDNMGRLWNLPTVIGDWYYFVIEKGDYLCGKLLSRGHGQVLKVGELEINVTKIKAWCRKDGNLNNENEQPENIVIVNEFLEVC